MLIRAAIIILSLLLQLQPSRADVISDWSDRAMTLTAQKPLLPPPAERVMALVHIAMFDAMNSIEGKYRAALVTMPNAGQADPAAAAATAAGTVLTALFPDQADATKSALTASLAAVPDGPAKADGQALGEAVGREVLRLRADDGADMPDDYRPVTQPGVYVPTAIPVSRVWPRVRPFCLQSPSQFRPGPPPALTSEDWATDYTEIKTMGAKTGSKRSASQSETARFWLASGPRAYYPTVHKIAEAKQLAGLEKARLLALVSMARFDAFIAVFEAKYHYMFWRPVTAIRNGDIDDNPATERDAVWEPIDTTPMHPEYPCAHCIIAATNASVLETVFGSADIPEVSATSTTMPGVTHSWTNVWDLANEVAEARTWAGFHYRFSTRAGQRMGAQIGELVARTMLQPTETAAATVRR
jgi:hypothetical protein